MSPRQFIREMAVIHKSHHSESMTGEERSVDYLEENIQIELDVVMTSEQRNVDTLLLAVSDFSSLCPTKV